MTADEIYDHVKKVLVACKGVFFVELIGRGNRHALVQVRFMSPYYDGADLGVTSIDLVIREEDLDTFTRTIPDEFRRAYRREQSYEDMVNRLYLQGWAFIHPSAAG